MNSGRNRNSLELGFTVLVSIEVRIRTLKSTLNSVDPDPDKPIGTSKSNLSSILNRQTVIENTERKRFSGIKITIFNLNLS